MRGSGDDDRRPGDREGEARRDPPGAGPDEPGRETETGIDPSEITGRESALPHEGEVDFETDVEFLHRVIVREAFEPEEGRERVPWWVWAIFALAIFWAGIYLGRYGGTFDTATHVALARVSSEVVEEISESAAELTADPIAAGRSIYLSRCQLCHQPDGSGMPGVFPPIIGAEQVVGDPGPLVLIILHGLAGPVTVQGQVYSGMMPGWGNVMSDAEVAAVASYVRQWETNDAGPVSPDQVAALRAATQDRTTPWTMPELEAVLASPEVGAAAGGGAPVEPTQGTAP